MRDENEGYSQALVALREKERALTREVEELRSALRAKEADIERE